VAESEAAPSGPSDDPPAEPSRELSGEPHGEPLPAPARRLGDVDERPIPRGCNPLVFGVAMATIQFAITVYFMRTC
jgi:hypothetical protein